MYLKSLEIERFRAFRHTDVSFCYPGAAASGKLKYPNINLLLGNNGIGKSAALKAAALALMSPVLASTGYRPYSLVRREVDKFPMDAAVKAQVALGDQDLEEDFDTTPEVLRNFEFPLTRVRARGRPRVFATCFRRVGAKSPTLMPAVLGTNSYAPAEVL